jgi:hypothetical protein
MKDVKPSGSPSVVLLWGIAVLLSACSQAPPERQAPPAVTIVRTMTRSITIPVRALQDRSTNSAQPAEDGTLTIRPEAQDQQAEGPQSFAVLDDGSLVIADPLADRLAVYSDGGVYQRSIRVGAPVALVDREGPGLRLSIAVTGDERVVGLDGQSMGRATIAEARQPSVVLNPDRSSGQIRWPGVAAAAGERSSNEITVQLQQTDRRLASLQVIAGGPNAPVYVVAESVERSGSALSTLTAIVRRYSPQGELDREVQGIPLDYYVTPKTPFRVVNGVLYQLFPKQDAVLIHVWDLRIRT